MSNPQASVNSDRFDVRASAPDHFAWLRTRLAVERTMLAWLRTAVSLIGFGFAIVQFFDRLEQMPAAAPARFPNSARYLGLTLIFCGIMTLAVSLWQYRWTLRYLWSESFVAIAGVTPEGKQTPLYAAAIVLILIGIYAFFVVFLRLA